MKPDLRKLIASEALAYLKSGLLAGSGRAAILERPSRRSELGVYFVPGYGANCSQLSPLKEALASEVDWFDGFEYRADRSAKMLAGDLIDAIDKVSHSCTRILVIGHSLGGLLARIALQSASPPRAIAGFVSICAPLHGTWRSRLAPIPELRALSPDGSLVAELGFSRHRLRALNGAILTVGSRFDSFIAPYESAFLEGEEKLCLEDVGHVGSLFDERVHRAVAALARRLKDGGEECAESG